MDFSPQFQVLNGRILKGIYRVDSELGRGAMGVVFRGTQLDLDKQIVIKLVLPSMFASPESIERFRREATLACKLIHPSVAQVFDFGEDEGLRFLVMEYVEGVDLADVIKREGPMPPARALAIIRQIASVLEEAERHRMIHRDLKPTNLRLMRYAEGAPIYLKVLDFGLAKRIEGDTQLTGSDAMVGTPAYMAPEQIDTFGRVLDGRVDQYATGVIFYELLTGFSVFEADSVPSLLLAHLHEAPAPLPTSLPHQVRQVVERLLSKQPEGRYRSAALLSRALDDLEPLCRDLPGLTRSGFRIRRPRKPKTRWLQATSVGLGAALTLLAALFILRPARTRHQQPIGAALHSEAQAADRKIGDVAASSALHAEPSNQNGRAASTPIADLGAAASPVTPLASSRGAEGVLAVGAGAEHPVQHKSLLGSGKHPHRSSPAIPKSPKPGSQPSTVARDPYDVSVAR